jgi:branched-chain amino acid aminotransferase
VAHNLEHVMTAHVDLHWESLGYDYIRTDWNYIAQWKDGAWDGGRLTRDNTVTISLGSTALHYAQECFEGLKAQTAQDGRILLFRPDQNAKRMQASARGILMPAVSEEQFLDACRQVVEVNRRWIPPYGSGAALYLRPVLFGHGDNLGAKPAKEYIFAVFGSPVGPYFKQGFRPITVVVSEYDRVAPVGTGALKVGGNYAAGLAARAAALKAGYADCLYLDPKTRTYIDEIGGTNFFGITRDQRFVTPDSPTILASITRRSVAEIAARYLGLTVEERLVPIAEIADFVEAGACGTASIITPVGGIVYQGALHTFYRNGEEAGPITRQLYDLLTAIQRGDHEAPAGWLMEI